MRVALAALALFGALAAPAAAQQDWDAVLGDAQGQEVFWNAWGGDDSINAYIAWVGDQVEARYGVALTHVKLADTADAVARVLAEKTAGRDEGGSIDLIWINGENFAAMKRADLLFGPFAEDLPNFQFVDTEGKPTTLVDFTVPTDGLEAPYGMARIVYMYDSAATDAPPRSIAEMIAYAEANPGRLTYPQPPDFLGSTFLKQALIEVIPDRAKLDAPVVEAEFAPMTAPLWAALDRLHPNLWRGGEQFPANGPAQRLLLADGEVDFSISFNPAEASSQIEQGLLPDSIRTVAPAIGGIGNTHFVAIPYNANAAAGAMVVANFLMSPEAQAHKQDPRIWGDFTVLDVAALPAEDRARFEALPLGVATLAPEDLGPTIPEPHPSWMTRIEQEWSARYER